MNKINLTENQLKELITSCYYAIAEKIYWPGCYGVDCDIEEEQVRDDLRREILTLLKTQDWQPNESHRAWLKNVPYSGDQALQLKKYKQFLSSVSNFLKMKGYIKRTRIEKVLHWMFTT